MTPDLTTTIKQVYLSTLQGVTTIKETRDQIQGLTDFTVEEAWAGIPCFSVDSSTIAFIGYHPGVRVLEIRFKSAIQKAYRYRNFSTADWDDLVQAKSQGKHFHAYIKGKYEYIAMSPKLYALTEVVKQT